MTVTLRAHLIALLLPTALMLGALGSQYIGGLFPCEMCWWQRYAHISAIALALIAFAAPQGRTRRSAIACAAGGILTSGLIAFFHAGVEYHWWQGFTQCTSESSGHTLADIMAAPLIRCDEAQWTFPSGKPYGISLAGFNALISVTGALYIFNLLRGATR